MSSLSRGSYISFGKFFLSHLPVFEIRAINHIYWILITPSLNPNTVYPPPPSYPRAPPPPSPSPSNQPPHRLCASAHSLQRAPLPHRLRPQLLAGALHPCSPPPRASAAGSRRGGPPHPAPASAAGSRRGGPPHATPAAAAAPRPPHAAARRLCHAPPLPRLPSPKKTS